MSFSESQIKILEALQKRYLFTKKWKESLLEMIDTVELSESVYNSNAIENSTLTLSDTEKILLDMKTPKNLHIREVYEARNLARIIEYIRLKSRYENLSQELILTMHEMLLVGINDEFAKIQETWRICSCMTPHCPSSRTSRETPRIRACRIWYKSQPTSYREHKSISSSIWKHTSILWWKWSYWSNYHELPTPLTWLSYDYHQISRSPRVLCCISWIWWEEKYQNFWYSPLSCHHRIIP